MLDSVFKAICLLVCLLSHTNVQHPMAEKKKLGKLLILDEVSIPAYSIFVEYSYMQLGGHG